MRNQQYMVGY